MNESEEGLDFHHHVCPSWLYYIVERLIRFPKSAFIFFSATPNLHYTFLFLIEVSFVFIYEGKTFAK